MDNGSGESGESEWRLRGSGRGGEGTCHSISHLPGVFLHLWSQFLLCPFIFPFLFLHSFYFHIFLPFKFLLPFNSSPISISSPSIIFFLFYWIGFDSFWNCCLFRSSKSPLQTTYSSMSVLISYPSATWLHLCSGWAEPHSVKGYLPWRMGKNEVSQVCNCGQRFSCMDLHISLMLELIPGTY